jgi:hypothetical protein
MRKTCVIGKSPENGPVSVIEELSPLVLQKFIKLEGIPGPETIVVNLSPGAGCCGANVPTDLLFYQIVVGAGSVH